MMPQTTFLGAASLAFLISACAAIQPIPEDQRTVQGVHEVQASKDVIFTRSLEWVAQTFVDSKQVIEFQDKENGKIIGKGFTSFTNLIVEIPCRFTIMI